MANWNGNVTVSLLHTYSPKGEEEKPHRLLNDVVQPDWRLPRVVSLAAEGGLAHAPVLALGAVCAWKKSKADSCFLFLFLWGGGGSQRNF